MKIIDEYRRLTEEIAVIESHITSTSREIQKLLDTYKPGQIKAIDYGAEMVQTSVLQSPLLLTTDRINELKDVLEELEFELKDVTEQRDKIEEVIEGFGNPKKKVLMLRIKGKTIEEVAKEMHYSERHVRRIHRNTKKLDFMY